MDERIATPDELKKWILISAGPGLALMLLFWYFGDIGRGFAAAIATYMIILNMGVFWRSRRHASFWVAISFVVFVHFLLIACIPWPRPNVPGRALLPFGIVDFLLIFGCFKLVQKILRQDAEP